MIHQFIFAGPKPGLSAQAFQSYWINFHAVDYAAKIPQIRQYLVMDRLSVAVPHSVPFFEGAAEIWLRNDEEQIASLQSREFIEGARADEPRWAAFWQSLGLDTESSVLYEGTDARTTASYCKLYLLLKRKAGIGLDEFRAKLTATRTQNGPWIASATRHEIGHARAGLYGLGEPRFDAVEVLSFTDETALTAALNEGGLQDEIERGWPFVELDYLYTFAGREHWIIRSGER